MGGPPKGDIKYVKNLHYLCPISDCLGGIMCSRALFPPYYYLIV